MPTALSIVRKFFPEVTLMTDAKKSVRVSVTKKDSNSSIVKNHKGCAMAVACKRKFALTGVVITRDRAYLVTGNQAVRYALPPSVSREVVSFDRGGGFEEGEYQLNRPAKIVKVSKNPRDRSERGGDDNNRRFVHQTGNIRTALGSKMLG
jgi:hypothetical protein